MALFQAISVNRTADDERVRASASILLLLMLGQAALGVWTLLAWVPVGLGVAHQAGAMLALSVTVWHLYAIRRADRA